MEKPSSNQKLYLKNASMCLKKNKKCTGILKRRIRRKNISDRNQVFIFFKTASIFLYWLLYCNFKIALYHLHLHLYHLITYVSVYFLLDCKLEVGNTIYYTGTLTIKYILSTYSIQCLVTKQLMQSEMLCISWFKYLQTFAVVVSFIRHRINVNEVKIEKQEVANTTISPRNLF